MAEIDDTLRQALARIAPDAETSGVADAIRARVAAGDTGTPASSSGFRAGLRGWLPFLGLLVIIAVLGFGLGISGVFGQPSLAGSTRSSTRPTAMGSATPTATASATATATAIATPSPIPVPPIVPVAPPAPPPKPRDTTAPILVVGTPSADTIWGIGSGCSPTSTTIPTTASDASGVASTTAVSSVAGTVIVHSGPPGATAFTVSVNEPGTDSIKPVTITVTSTDAAGNSTTGKAIFSLWGAQNCIG